MSGNVSSLIALSFRAKNMIHMRISVDKLELYEQEIDNLLKETKCLHIDEFIEKYKSQDTKNFVLFQRLQQVTNNGDVFILTTKQYCCISFSSQPPLLAANSDRC